jgi:tetratricopeptide (TPR) repeat protein
MVTARLRILVVLAFVLTNLPQAFAVQDQTLMSAAALIKSGDSKAAYEMLEPLESARSGDVDFDSLFGVAAIDSGNVTRGVFALERVLAVDPNNAEARAEIAKGYYLLGENETAKAEFQNVLQQQPPEDAKQVINSYLSAIDKNLGLSTRFAAFLDFTFGHDSNVNSATSVSTVAPPAFGGVPLPLSKSGQQRPSNFINYTGGVSFQYPFSQNLSLFGGFSAGEKVNTSQQSFDTDSVDFNLGSQYKWGSNTYTLAAQDSDYYVNSTQFRHAYGLNGQWQYDWDSINQLSLFFQATRLEYPAESIRDADRHVVGAGWGHAFAGDKSPVAFFSAYVGDEVERASGVPHLGNNFYGLRAGGQFAYNPKTVVYAAATYEYRDYGGPDPSFLKPRSDDQYDLSLGIRYFPGNGWTIKPQFSYTKNDSNIIIYEYDRYLLSVSFRRDFNW